MDPGRPLPLFNLGCLMMESGDSSRADSVFVLLLELHPGYGPAETNLRLLRDGGAGP